MKIGHITISVGPVTEDIAMTGVSSIEAEFVPSHNLGQPLLSKSEAHQLLRDATFGFEGTIYDAFM
jgi:hypothetical protein